MQHTAIGPTFQIEATGGEQVAGGHGGGCVFVFIGCVLCVLVWEWQLVVESTMLVSGI